MELPENASDAVRSDWTEVVLHGRGWGHGVGLCQIGAAVMAGVSLLLTVLVIPTGGELIALFGAGEEAIAIGDNFFRRIASFYVVFGLATAVRSYLEGMGDVVYSSLAGMTSLACRIFLSYALVGVFANMVIAYAEAFSWVLLLLLYLVRMVWKERQWRKHGFFSEGK